MNKLFVSIILFSSLFSIVSFAYEFDFGHFYYSQYYIDGTLIGGVHNSTVSYEKVIKLFSNQTSGEFATGYHNFTWVISTSNTMTPIIYNQTYIDGVSNGLGNFTLINITVLINASDLAPDFNITYPFARINETTDIFSILVNYYKADQTYNRSEINSAILGNATSFNSSDYYTVNQTYNRSEINSDVLNNITSLNNTINILFYKASDTYNKSEVYNKSETYNRTEIDNLIPLDFKYYFNDVTSLINNSYRSMNSTEQPSISEITSASLSTGTHLVVGRMSDATTNITKISDGSIHIHTHTIKDSGTKTVSYYGELWKHNVTGEFYLLTTHPQTPTQTLGVEYEVELHADVPTEIDLDEGVNLIWKLYATISGLGSNVVVKVRTGGTTHSGLELPVSIGAVSISESDPVWNAQKYLYYSTSQVFNISQIIISYYNVNETYNRSEINSNVLDNITSLNNTINTLFYKATQTYNRSEINLALINNITDINNTINILFYKASQTYNRSEINSDVLDNITSLNNTINTLFYKATQTYNRSEINSDVLDNITSLNNTIKTLYYNARQTYNQTEILRLNWTNLTNVALTNQTNNFSSSLLISLNLNVSGNITVNGNITVETNNTVAVGSPPKYLAFIYSVKGYFDNLTVNRLTLGTKKPIYFGGSICMYGNTSGVRILGNCDV